MYTLVIALFFFEHLFLGRSLMPLDLLNQMLVPRAPGASISLQTHYGIDQITQLAPNLNFWRESVWKGEFPLWNPYFMGGHPHHGATGWTMLGVFKLPLLLPGSMDRIFTLTTVFEFWLAGMLMFLLLRSLGRSRPASLVGACGWALCSNLLMFHWIFLNVFVWVPLLLYCWDRFWAGGRLGWGFATAVVMALAFLGGSVQMVAFVGFLWGIWSLGGLEGWTFGQLRRWCLMAFGTFAVAAMLCMAQWMPTLEFLGRETQRLQNLDPGAFGLKHALLGPWIAAVQLFVPAAVGSPQTFDLLKLIRGSAIDFNGYIGVVPALLALLGLGGPWDRRTRNLVGLIMVVLLLVFFTPFQKFLYHRFLLLAVFGLVVLSARGMDMLMMGAISGVRLQRVFRGALWLGCGVLVGLGVARGFIGVQREWLTTQLEQQVVAGAASNQFGTHLAWLLGRVPKFLDHYAPWNPEFLIPALVAGVFGYVGLRELKRRTQSNLTALIPWIVGLTVLDVSWSLRARVSRVDPAHSPSFVLPKVLEPIQRDPDWFRVHRWMPGDKLTLMDNLGWTWGFHQWSGYESMSPDGMSRLPLDEANGFNAILDLCSVKYVICGSGERMPSPRFELVSEDHGTRVYRNHAWLKPVQWVMDVAVVSSTAEAVARMREPGFNPSRQVILTPDMAAVGVAGATNAVEPRTASVTVHDRTAQRLMVEVAAPSKGYVVFAETWFPGWRVWVDGIETTVLRVDAHLQGVAVGPGLHQVEFRFQPASFVNGTRVSLGTLILGLCVSALPRRRTSC